MNHSNFSCIKQVVKTVHLTLPPSYISNEIAGVTEIFDNWKRQYVHQLQGVVVNYKNISLSSRMGFIHISKAYVHYDVTATFDLFCPSVGDIVKGTINRISPEHIGCLIQGTINVTIHMPDNTSEALSKFIQLNHEILFQITHFGFNRNTIRVNGQITPQCVELMEELFPPIEEKNKRTKKAAKLRYSALDRKSGNTNSDSENSNNELSTELKLFTSNSCQINSNTVKSSSESNSDDEPKGIQISNKKNIAMTDVLQSLKMEIETDPENNFKESSIEVHKLKNSKKRKRESDSFDSPGTSEEKKVKHKKLKQEIMSPIPVSKTSLMEKSPKKKHKEKLKLSSSKKMNHNNNLDINMVNSNDLESVFTNCDLSDHTNLMKNIKQEAESVKKKRKHESSTSDAQETLLQKKKKHKKKDSKASKEKNADKSKLKPSSKKAKLITAGDIIKKDKKKSHKSKHPKSKRNAEVKHKDKKKKSKKGFHAKSDSNLNLPVTIKPELN